MKNNIDINEIDPWSIDSINVKSINGFCEALELKSVYKKISNIQTYNFYSQTRDVLKVFIHHSEFGSKDLDSVDAVAWIHKNHKFFNFTDIGYHFFIKRDGSLYSGRSIDEDPASQYGFNKKTISICVSGNDGATKDQKTTLRNISDKINELYDRNISFHGHCELFDEAFWRMHFKSHKDFISYKNRCDDKYLASKLSCPGFNYKSLLKLGDDGYMKY